MATMTQNYQDSIPAAKVRERKGFFWRLLRLVPLLIFAGITIFLAFGASLIPLHFRAGMSPIFLPLKCMMPAFVWGICWISALCCLVGLAVVYRRTPARTAWLLFAGVNAVCAIAAAVYIARVTASRDEDFKDAFGKGWEYSTTPNMLAHRWSPIRFSDPEPRIERDVDFATIPGTDRHLLADLWLPPAAVKSSGLAYLYFHGSSWHMADKGWGTDTAFRHIAAQGHVVMDVSYRLAPEADLIGMVGDVKRSVAWMKANAQRLGVNPNRIVLAGASAGGEIALLAAYAPTQPEFAVPELSGTDPSVHAVVAYYSPASMREFITSELGKFAQAHTRATAKKALTDPKTNMPNGPMPTEQMMKNVMGGLPDEAPKMYDLAEVRTHVTPQSPPTLIIEGEFDSVAKAEASRALVTALRTNHVPVIGIFFPDTDHAFDVFTQFFARFGLRLPIDSQFAPPTQSALYDQDRFLAVMARNQGQPNKTSKQQ